METRILCKSVNNGDLCLSFNTRVRHFCSFNFFNVQLGFPFQEKSQSRCDITSWLILTTDI